MKMTSKKPASQCQEDLQKPVSDAERISQLEAENGNLQRQIILMNEDLKEFIDFTIQTLAP